MKLDKMKIICISDTHNKHDYINVPEGDMLIHAGDVSMMGRENEVIPFINWFNKQPHKYKIFIAGNHDWSFEQKPEWLMSILKNLPENTFYLEDSGINIEGINIWGSPYQPRFFDWAFNVDRGEKIRKHWDLIPKNTDILITHGPVRDILDQARPYESFNCGCDDLKIKVEEINPKLHIFGHIHGSYGIFNNGNICHINASSVNEKYQPVNKPINFNYDFKI